MDAVLAWILTLLTGSIFRDYNHNDTDIFLNSLS